MLLERWCLQGDPARLSGGVLLFSPRSTWSVGAYTWIASAMSLGVLIFVKVGIVRCATSASWDIVPQRAFTVNMGVILRCTTISISSNEVIRMLLDGFGSD